MNSDSISTLLNAHYVPGVMPLVFTYPICFTGSFALSLFADEKNETQAISKKYEGDLNPSALNQAQHTVSGIRSVSVVSKPETKTTQQKGRLESN